ncbi:hypothetical protein GCM10023116_05650 [Kistimonas scapharcae]|uniref:Uncharacterized protein n=1 Tax=Kistimonas scapharcae TaxID=1036133 RepID=A0ABP8UWL3_9GAMM
MSESNTGDLFGSAQSDSVRYLLTGRRNLNRLLDIGLLAPELIASSEQGLILFAKEDLSGLASLEGYPAVPLLIELKDVEQKSGHGVLSVSSINRIHFPSTEDLEDYRAKGYSNVPDQLFEFVASPDLFAIEDSHERIITGRLDRKNAEALKDRYRNFDVQGGLFWNYLQSLEGIDKVTSFLSRLEDLQNSPELFESLKLEMLNVACEGSRASDFQKILLAYLEVIAAVDVDEGWVPVTAIASLKDRIPTEIQNGDVFLRWYDIAQAVINNERELPPLDDEGKIPLRAILLHVLNPDAEAIQRMACRESPPGAQVIAVASSFAAAKSGFSSLDSVHKSEFPGRYYLVADFLASLINIEPLRVSEFLEQSESDGITEIFWKSSLLGRYQSESGRGPEAVAVAATVAETPALERSELQLKLVDMLHAVPYIADANIDDGYINIELEKSVCLAVYGRPKLSVFIGNDVCFRTTLLDIKKTKTHGSWLTKVVLSGLMEYQSNESSDFRFEFPQQEILDAVITMGPQGITEETLDRTLKRLLDTHGWLKSSKKQ